MRHVWRCCCCFPLTDCCLLQGVPAAQQDSLAPRLAGAVALIVAGALQLQQTCRAVFCMMGRRAGFGFHCAAWDQACCDACWVGWC